MKVLGSRIWVEGQEEQEVSASGIIMTDGKSKKNPTRGKVAYQGSKVEEQLEGNEVVFGNKYTRVEHEDKTYLEMDIENVLAVIG